MARANSKTIFTDLTITNELFGFKDDGKDVNIPLYAVRDLFISSLTGVTNEFVLSETLDLDGSLTSNSLIIDDVTTLTFNNQGIRGGSFLDYFEMLDNNKNKVHLKLVQVGSEITAAFSITSVSFNVDGTTTFEVNLLGDIKIGALVLDQRYYLDIDISNLQPDYTQTDETSSDFIKNKPETQPLAFIDGLVGRLDSNDSDILENQGDITTNTNSINTINSGAEFKINKGQPNGYASLDAAGLILPLQLPSYVDDVLEFANLATFPTTGEAGKIYVALDDNKTYRWSGSTYIYITSGAVDSVNSQTGVVSLDTSNIPEVTNLYYTQTRFDSAFTAKSTTDLSEGTNLYYTQNRFDAAFTSKSTTNLSEGDNLYYTDLRVKTYGDTLYLSDISDIVLDDTNLVVVPETGLQSFAEAVDGALLRVRGTGVATTYVSSVAVGGTTFAQPAVKGEINSDEGYFSIDYAGATGVTVINLSSASTYVYVDKSGALQQQTSIPTREDWSRKVFTMRIAIDLSSNTIVGFEYLNNPIGHYANSIRDVYSYLLKQGIPFKEDQTVTGRANDLGFDISAGSIMEFGGTGDINNANIKSVDAVSNATFFLSERTTFDAGGNTDLPKYWDNNGVLTALGSTTVVGHRLYRFSNGNLIMQYGQGNYANMSLAKTGALLEDYVLNPVLKNATFFGWWFIESTATNTGGTTLTDFLEYTIGIQGGSSSGLSGCLLKGNNLSDLLDLSEARTNLGLDTTANQNDSTNKRFMTDVQEAILDNTSGTNTGDQTLPVNGDFSLDNLSDTTITDNSEGEVLIWSGTAWINSTLAEADIETKFSKNDAFNKNFGTTAGTVAQGNDSRLSDARTPLSHNHGNITNGGLLGVTPNLPIITGTGGILQAGSFGTTANTFMEGRTFGTAADSAIGDFAAAQDLNDYQLLSEKDAVSGYAGLDGSGKINSSQLPSIAVTDTFVVASQAAMLALTVEVGDVAVRTDIESTFILRETGATVLANWTELQTPTDAVSSVFGRSGVVTAESNDYTWAQIDKTTSSLADVTTRNFSDLQNKPTTISGYSITDAYTKTETDANYIQNTTTQQTADLNISGTGVFGGNVGVGTNNPLAINGGVSTKLHAKGAILVSEPTEVGRFEGGLDGDGASAIVRIGTSNDRGLYLEGGRTGVVQFGAIGVTDAAGARSEVLRLKSDLSAEFASSVSATDGIFSGLINANSSDSFGLNIVRDIAANSNTAIRFQQLLGDAYVGVNASGDFAFNDLANLASPKFKVSRAGAATFASSVSATDGNFSGNVGVGTASPQSKAHISSGSTSETTLTIGASGDNTNVSARIFLNEGENTVTDSKKYGFSLAYDGQGGNYGLSANEFAIIRHDNSEVGSKVLSIQRTTGSATFASSVTATGLNIESDSGSSFVNISTESDANKSGLKLRQSSNFGFDLNYNDSTADLGRGFYINTINNDVSSNAMFIDRSTGAATFASSVSATDGLFSGVNAVPLQVQSSNATLTRLSVQNTSNGSAGSGIALSVKNGASTVGVGTLKIGNTGTFSIFNGSSTESENFSMLSSGAASFASSVSLSSTTGRLFGGTTTGKIELLNSDSTSYMVINGSSNASPNVMAFIVDQGLSLTLNSDNSATFASSVTATNFILSSDERLKKYMTDVSANIKIKANWKTYELKTEEGQLRYGVGASELEKVHPEFVRTDSKGFKSVAYIDLLVAKSAQLENEAIEDKENSAKAIKLLTTKIDLLEARLEKAGI